MRIISHKIFSMLRNQSGWYLMACFETTSRQDGYRQRLLIIGPHMLNEIKRRPIKETLNKKIKNE